MNQLKLFINLTRLNKPIGFMLLFWPCSWGLAFAYNLDKNINNFLFFLLLFFLGSVLMRSAGCIFNDIVDEKIDQKVGRTKNRPIASGKLSKKNAFVYIVVLCLLAFLILIQFNNLTIAMGLASMILAFSYPFMKRITYWPQLFLGLTFNWGILMGWAALLNYISFDIILLYISAIFWTLGYDTIYGAQDLTDDEIIGNKSTAIKFKKNIKIFVSLCYLISSTIIILLFNSKMQINFKTLPFLLFFISLLYQLILFDKNNPSRCLQCFKINNWSGLFLFSGIIGFTF
jgi:4-hydroxybenzoate polyprenyltransferase